MIERDLYREIEQELEASKRAAKKAWWRAGLGIIFSGVLLLMAVSGWQFVTKKNPIETIISYVRPSATPTATLVPTPTQTLPPTPAPTPTAEPSVAVVATETPMLSTPTPTKPLPPTPTATPNWASFVGSPLASEMQMVRLSLKDLGGATAIIALPQALGYTGNPMLRERTFVGAQTPGFKEDNLVQPDTLLRGALPNKPLFLFIGEMVGSAEFTNDVGKLYVKVPWNTSLVEAFLPSELIAQVANPSLTMNVWPSKGGYIWMLASSPALEQALIGCRNTAPVQSIHLMPDVKGDCKTIVALSTTEKIDVTAEVVMGVRFDGTGLEPLLPKPPTPLTNRWIYADFGRYGLQLAMSDDDDKLINSSGIGFGLVRANWLDTNQLKPNLFLKPIYDNGVYYYEYLWKQ